MTLITRINCGLHVYIASDCQVNDAYNIRIHDKIACKSRIVPNSLIILGIAGLISKNNESILDHCVNSISSNNSVNIQDCITAIDASLMSILSSETGYWYCVFMISLVENGNLDHHVYIIDSKGLKLLERPIFFDRQKNNFFLRNLFDDWSQNNYEDNDHKLFWTDKIDFNVNYSHLISQVDYQDEWRIFTKPYTLLYFILYERGLSFQSICDMSEEDLKYIIIEFYEKARNVHTLLYRFESDKSEPFNTIGPCNHIIKLDLTNLNTKIVYKDDPC